MDMKVLIACEESQRVCTAFRALGYEAYSCDIQERSGGHPEWHIQGDCLPLLDGNCEFTTAGGQTVRINGRWDLLIAHPPCTYLTAMSACVLFKGGVIDRSREQKMREAAVFFRRMLDADCERIAVENPAPLHIAGLPPYSQIIQPYMFGDPWKKRTCLWLKNLPRLQPTNIVEPQGCWVYSDGPTSRTKLLNVKGVRSPKERAKTFPGIAQAMAEQWGRYALKAIPQPPKEAEP